MASCSPCRFMFGDYIRISAGMEPMLYPDCERERAGGLRGGQACMDTGSVGRAELRGGRACAAIWSIGQPELRGLYFAVILYVVAICGF